MDSLNQALVECVKALGGSGKVGPKLWPERSQESAQRAFIETQSRMADMLGRMERIQGVQSFPTLRAAA